MLYVQTPANEKIVVFTSLGGFILGDYTIPESYRTPRTSICISADPKPQQGLLTRTNTVYTAPDRRVCADPTQILLNILGLVNQPHSQRFATSGLCIAVVLFRPEHSSRVGSAQPRSSFRQVLG